MMAESTSDGDWSESDIYFDRQGGAAEPADADSVLAAHSSPQQLRGGRAQQQSLARDVYTDQAKLIPHSKRTEQGPSSHSSSLSEQLAGPPQLSTPLSIARPRTQAQHSPGPAMLPPSLPVAISAHRRLPLQQQSPNKAQPYLGSFVPPHEYLAQTLPDGYLGAQPMFKPGSVMEGKGRKLQGSEQIRFRAAIMRQTGFLENSEDSQKRQDSPAVTVR